MLSANDISRPDATIGSIVALYATLALVLLFHEIGHIAAARKLGIKVDGVYAGIYLIIPAFFTNISLISILPKFGRILVYGSGIIFQIYISLALSFYLIFYENEFLLYILVSNWILIFLNLIPIIHLDGFRILHEYLATPTTHIARRILKAFAITLTSCFVVFILAILTMSVWQFGSSAFQEPTITTIILTVIFSAILIYILFILPKWVRKPYG